MSIRNFTLAGVALLAITSGAACAAVETAAEAGAVDHTLAGAVDDIIVTGTVTQQVAGTKTATPLIETPQPITIVSEDMFRAQGAINLSDTLNYVAGVTANAYGRDTRVDGFVVRGIEALQFRDGMRDIFSFYASIASDPYNFSRVEVVRGPASVLFGQGSIGGIVNFVSKTPEFETRGEAGATYGSYDRKELTGDVNYVLNDRLAVRLVGRARNADTYVDHVPDDRVLISPSIRWKPTDSTDITLLGLYQEDDTGSTSQFLPIVGTLRENPGQPRLPRYLFVGKPGWDRYDGRSLQGTAILNQQLGDAVKLSMRARYIDSDLSYFTHYPDSYSNPADPYSVYGTNGRTIGLYSDASVARLNVFSTDNNLQYKFDTGSAIEHLLLAGIDYSWNRVKKFTGSGVDVIDIYDIDYDALTIPTISSTPTTNDSQKQLGVYLQDQIRAWDRVSIVLGVRRDHVTSPGIASDNATTFRAGIIGEIGAGLSPFASYTESFLPVAGMDGNGDQFEPQRGKQYEYGVKWQPDRATLVSVTGFDISEVNRIVYGTGSQIFQSGRLKTTGFEIEASRLFAGNYEILVNYGYNKVRNLGTISVDFLPRETASIWGTRTIDLGDDLSLRIGAGVRHTGKRRSGDIVTASNTLVDALAELNWRQFRFSLNATNLFDDRFYASCLARGDCFVGAPRNVMGTVGVRF
jgi:iron complex outermembrane receptor protein